MNEKAEQKRYLYEPTEKEIEERSRKIRTSRAKDLRKSRYVPPHDDSRRAYRVHLPRKPLS